MAEGAPRCPETSGATLPCVDDGHGGLLSRAEVTEWIRERIERREPAALVRFAEGEGKVLAASNDDPESLKPPIRTLKRQTGVSFSPDAVFAVQARLALAFDEADVLGIRYFDGSSAEARKWLDQLAARHSERVAAGRQPAALAHCLLDWSPLPELLAGRRIGVISCRDVKPVLESEWGVEDVAVYQVPSQHVVRDVDGAYEATMHGVPMWPDAHARVRAELTVREQGEVFLVGAGLFGKDLCIRVRDLGGIALDMGSGLDRIAGKITRGPKRRALELRSGGMSVEEIAADFHRTYGFPVAPARIAEILSKIDDAGRAT